jgi:hypothetical protein
MSAALDAALDHASHGREVFPCRQKTPLIPHGFKQATRDEQQIRQWWQRWPEAWIGVATGRRSGIVVLDVDVKDDRAYGWDTLDSLGKAILPETWMAHTPTGGTHIYFAAIDVDIGCSIGKGGLGPGLDVRGEGGYVIAPPSPGYWWDPHCNPDTVSLAPAPAWLGHREKVPAPKTKRSGCGFDPLAVLDQACANIRNAADGDKYRTVRREVFIASCLVRDQFVPERQARHTIEAALLSLSRRVKDRDHMTAAYEGAFAEGLVARGKRR